MNVTQLRLIMAAFAASLLASPGLAATENPTHPAAAPSAEAPKLNVPVLPAGMQRGLPAHPDFRKGAPPIRNERAAAEKKAQDAKLAEVQEAQKAQAERRAEICAENEEAGKLAQEIADLREQLKAKREALDAIYQKDAKLTELAAKEAAAESAAEEHRRGVMREVRNAMRERMLRQRQETERRSLDAKEAPDAAKTSAEETDSQPAEKPAP